MKLTPEILADKHLLNKVLRGKRNTKHQDKRKRALERDFTHELHNETRTHLSRFSRSQARAFYYDEADE